MKKIAAIAVNTATYRGGVARCIKSEYDKVGMSSLLRRDGFTITGIAELYEHEEDEETDTKMP